MGSEVEDRSGSIHLAGPWRVWPQVCVRGTGFPIAAVQTLASQSLLEGYEEYVTWLRERDRCSEVVADYFKRRFGYDRAGDIKTLRLLERAFGRGQLAAEQARGFDPHLGQLIERFEEAERAARDAAHACERLYEKEAEGIRAALRGIARSGPFQEALVWQNRRLRHRINSGLGASDTKGRQLEAVVTSYIQRYCTKNETIGWFGPCGWGRFTRDGPDFEIEIGNRLVSRRQVHFEYWVMDELCRAFEREPGVKLSLKPRPHPGGDDAGHGTNLTALERSVLALADGTRCASQIARAISRIPDPDHPDACAVVDCIARLEKAGLLIWSLLLPVTRLPEEGLRGRLEEIGDAGVRDRLCRTLDEFTSDRGRIAALASVEAAPDPERLDKAIARLERRFTRLTGLAATRNPGKPKGGRGMIYEDCERDLAVNMGPGIRRALGPPLALVLTSARWFNHRIGEAFSEVFESVFADCRGEADSGVPLAMILPLLTRRRQAVVDAVAGELQQRWARVLRPRRGQRRITHGVADLEAKVERLFEAPRAAWPSGYIHSPDILIAAEDPAAIDRGECWFVLGELHTSSSTLAQPLFRLMYAAPEDIVARLDEDRPEPELELVVSRNYPIGHRTTHERGSMRDPKIAFDETPSEESSDGLLVMRELSIDSGSEGLRIRCGASGRTFPITALFRTILSPDATTRFDIRPDQDHLPRASIDRLTVWRETWRIAARDMVATYMKSPSERFLGAQMLRRGYRMPRRIFVRFPFERKPFFLDFASPPLIDLFLKNLRRQIDTDPQARVIFTEMLPGPSLCWLRDKQGNQYTSELRFSVTDTLGLSPGRGSLETQT